MNLHLRSNLTATGEQARGRPLMTIAGLVAALALVAGVGAYQVAGNRNRADTRITSLQPAPAVAPVGGDRASAVGQPDENPIVFIVKSGEHAAALRPLTLIPQDVWSGIGPRPHVPHVLVTDIDAVILAEALPRTPGTVFIDLRTN